MEATIKQLGNRRDDDNNLSRRRQLRGRQRQRKEQKRRKSNHVASYFRRAVARTYEIVKLYDQGLISTSHI